LTTPKKKDTCVLNDETISKPKKRKREGIEQRHAKKTRREKADNSLTPGRLEILDGELRSKCNPMVN